MHRIETKDALGLNGPRYFDGAIGYNSMEWKASAKEEGHFEGYASVFGNKDLGWDIMEAGAFTSSITERGAKGIKMLWQHDTRDIIGVWDEMHEDTHGLFVKGRLLMELPQAKIAWTLVQAEQLDSMSIGYKSEDDTWDETVNARRLKKVDLREISLVTFAMNEAALITRVKSGYNLTKRDLESHLARDVGMGFKKAKALLAGGYETAMGERDATVDEETKELGDMFAQAAKLFRS